MPTYTSRPPKLQKASAPPMLAALPVASTTTSHIRPSVRRLTASTSAGVPVASHVSDTPIDARTKSSRD